MTYATTGATIKRSLSDLVRGGCRIDRIAHDPMAVTFTAANGSRAALRTDGRLYLLEDGQGTARFYSLDAALAAALASTALAPMRAVAS